MLHVDLPRLHPVPHREGTYIAALSENLKPSFVYHGECASHSIVEHAMIAWSCRIIECVIHDMQDAAAKMVVWAINESCSRRPQLWVGRMQPRLGGRHDLVGDRRRCLQLQDPRLRLEARERLGDLQWRAGRLDALNRDRRARPAPPTSRQGSRSASPSATSTTSWRARRRRRSTPRCTSGSSSGSTTTSSA